MIRVHSSAILDVYGLCFLTFDYIRGRWMNPLIHLNTVFGYVMHMRKINGRNSAACLVRPLARLDVYVNGFV